VATQKQAIVVAETKPRMSLEFCVRPYAQARPGRYHHDIYQGEASGWVVFLLSVQSLQD
jgi:hypothetical protein